MTLFPLSRKDLNDMSLEYQLGYLQYLAGRVYECKDLPENVREDALTTEEVGCKRYKDLATGRCSLQSMLDYPIEKIEKEVLDMIQQYRQYLGVT